MRTVKQITEAIGCYTDALGVSQSVMITREYHYCPDTVGVAAKLFATHYTTSAGANIVGATALNVVPGACAISAKEADKFIKCDPATGETKVIVVTYSATFVPTSVAYNLDGSPYAGSIAALIECPDVELESDYEEFCDGGVDFMRWYVKQNGTPTGQYFDTTIIGLPYTATPAAVVGACSDICTPIAPVGLINTWG
jgi:hypothetical protein